MESVYNQKVVGAEIAVMDYLDQNKYFFEPQKLLAERVGYTRESVNKAIKSLHKKGLITVSRSRNLNKQLRLIALSGEVDYE